jgi:hypothetical protein
MEERRVRVFDDRVLRKVFGSSWEEVTLVWRKLHNENLHDLRSSNIIRVKRIKKKEMMGHVTTMGERRGACRGLMRRAEGK